MIGTRTAIADRPHRITLQTAGPNVPDGDGGSTHGWLDLDPPQVFGKVAPATATDLERLGATASTVLTTQSRLVTLPYHPGLTNLARILWADRHGVSHTASVTGQAANADDTETMLLCEELAGEATP